MKNLAKDDDVRSTRESAEGTTSYVLSIPDDRTPWRLIRLDYSDGFVHWCDIGGNSVRVPCAGGIEGKGFATDVCPICKKVLDLYQQAKISKDPRTSANLKEQANRMRAKIEIRFLALRGNRVVVLNQRTGKKEVVADWDMEAEENPARAGVLSLSKSQFDGLVGMIRGENTPFIKVGDDLGNRTLWTRKESKNGKRGKYSAVVWSADPNPSDFPDVKIPDEILNLDLDADFKYDPVLAKKVIDYLDAKDHLKEHEDLDSEVIREEIPEEEYKKTAKTLPSKSPSKEKIPKIKDEDPVEDFFDTEEKFEDDIPF